MLLALTACGPRADAKTVAEVFLSAREVGDVEGAVSVMSPEVVMRAPNALEYRGLAQVRQWLQASVSDYSYQLTEAPTLSGAHVSWRDNLYSLTGSRWVGELAWEVSVTDLKITAISGRVVRGASGIICPQCPPGTRI
ncbi:MAG TPA: nuclear transport factor 2 family protein [Chloroflexota bacterium]